MQEHDSPREQRKTIEACTAGPRLRMAAANASPPMSAMFFVKFTLGRNNCGSQGDLVSAEPQLSFCRWDGCCNVPSEC